MPGLQVQHRLDHDGVAVVRLVGDLDGSSAAASRDELLACCTAAAVIIDGAQVRSCDPVALELLVTAQQAVRSAGGRFAVAAPSFALAKTLRTTGLASWFTITSTIHAAHTTVTGAPPRAHASPRHSQV